MSENSKSTVAEPLGNDPAAPTGRSPRARNGRRFAVGGLAVLAAATLALTACSSSKNTSGGTAPTTSAGGSSAAGGVTISAVSGRLVGPNGHTLYVNNEDTMTSIKCTGECAEEWPPLIGTPTETGTLQPTDFATTTRPDGTMQVTFQGHPLYYFADDKSAGDVKGNITDDGVVWHSADSSVVSTTGGVTSAPASSSGSGNGY